MVALVVDGTDSVWKRVIDADLVEVRYGLGSLMDVVVEGGSVRLVGSVSTTVVPAAELDAAFALPSSSFVVDGVTRDRSMDSAFAFIGDSVGVGITESGVDELPALLDGVFTFPRYDAVGSRCSADPGCRSTGLDAANAVPEGTEVVVMELGLNDASGSFATKIDQVMNVFVAKGVDTVLWLTISTRSTYASAWAAPNNAQLVSAAAGRWNGRLQLVDWNAFSTGAAKDAWFYTDRIHLRPTGQAEMATFIRDAVMQHLPPAVEPT